MKNAICVLMALIGSAFADDDMPAAPPPAPMAGPIVVAATSTPETAAVSATSAQEPSRRHQRCQASPDTMETA